MRTDGLLVVATPMSSACSTSWTKFEHRRVVLRVRSTSFALALYELDLTVIISLSRALALPARPCWSSPRCCAARMLFKLHYLIFAAPVQRACSTRLGLRIARLVRKLYMLDLSVFSALRA